MKTDGEQIDRHALILLCAYRLRKSLGALYGAHKDKESCSVHQSPGIQKAWHTEGTNKYLCWVSNLSCFQ